MCKNSKICAKTAKFYAKVANLHKNVPKGKSVENFCCNLVYENLAISDFCFMTSSAYHYNAKDLQAETPRGNPLGHPALPKCPAELARLHQLPAGDQPVDQWAGPRRLQALPLFV